jgi:hypothetical protein
MPITGDWMLRSLIALVCTLALVGCFESTPKLSKDEEHLLDAVTYFFTGLEDNFTDGVGRSPWQREVKGRGIEFSRVSRNGIGSSSEEFNRKTRPSKYVRYLRRISLVEPCAFQFEEITDFSKGDSQQDFSAYSMKSGTNVIFNLANAYHFNFNTEDLTPAIELAGPRVVCDAPDSCQNSWNSFMSGVGLGTLKGSNDENKRRLGAFILIKKSCPGKPY